MNESLESVYLADHVYFKEKEKSDGKFMLGFVCYEVIGREIFKVNPEYRKIYSDRFSKNHHNTEFFQFDEDIEKIQVRLSDENCLKEGDEVFVYSPWQKDVWIVGKLKKFENSQTLYCDENDDVHIIGIHFCPERKCWANGTFINKEVLELPFELKNVKFI